MSFLVIRRTVSVIAVFSAALDAAEPAAVEPAAAPVKSADNAAATIIHDLPYAGEKGHARQKLDLYLPIGAKKSAPLPVIVWVHGGGWAAGDKSDCPAKSMVEHGYAVVSVGYRLSGDAVFPAQIEDCKAAIRWLRAHAADFNLDVKHFGAWGNSAGGHLVALLGTSGDVKSFDVGADLDQSSRVQAVCDYYGPTDLLQMDAHALPNPRIKHDMAQSPESRLVGGPIQENKDKVARLNPITYVTPDDPPFLIVHGDQDTTVPPHQNTLLFEALKKAGLTVHIHTIAGAGHGPGIGGKEVDAMVQEFFDRYLKGDAKPDGNAIATHGTANLPPGLVNGPAGAAARGAPGPVRRPNVDWARVSRDDGNSDGVVTREEFKGPPPLFDILDTNHDGKLTKDDFAAPSTDERK